MKSSVREFAGIFAIGLLAPTENADGSFLDDLAGYRIYCAVAESNYPNETVIDNPAIATCVVENLTPATHDCLPIAVHSNGLKS